MTNWERMRRRLWDNPHCHCCADEKEDLSHLFRKYTRAQPVWYRLTGDRAGLDAQNLQLPKWIT